MYAEERVWNQTPTLPQNPENRTWEEMRHCSCWVYWWFLSVPSWADLLRSTQANSVGLDPSNVKGSTLSSTVYFQSSKNSCLPNFLLAHLKRVHSFWNYFTDNILVVRQQRFPPTSNMEVQYTQAQETITLTHKISMIIVHHTRLKQPINHSEHLSWLSAQIRLWQKEKRFLHWNHQVYPLGPIQVEGLKHTF